MKLYILIKKEEKMIKQRYLLGGGSSTKPRARVYHSLKTAEGYAERFNAKVVEIEL